MLNNHFNVTGIKVSSDLVLSPKPVRPWPPSALSMATSWLSAESKAFCHTTYTTGEGIFTRLKIPGNTESDHFSSHPQLQAGHSVHPNLLVSVLSQHRCQNDSIRASTKPDSPLLTISQQFTLGLRLPDKVFMIAYSVLSLFKSIEGLRVSFISVP